MQKLTKIIVVLFLSLFSRALFSQEQVPSDSFAVCADFQRKNLVWDTNYTHGNWYLIKGNKLDLSENNIQNLVIAWNATYGVKIKLREAKRTTLYVDIADESNFARSYGSSGAMRVLAALVYTLTEDVRYKNVYLNFEEGEHASPEKYSREDFLGSFLRCDYK